MSQPSVITRFAPSPTGHLHIGGARSALFCWAYARRHGGHFVLRIEDTDQARNSDESARGIMEDLAWLGIDWDEGPEFRVPPRSAWGRSGVDEHPHAERGGAQTIGGDPRGVGPFFQARRVHLYNKYIMQLVEQGKAYPAFEKSEELDAKRKAAVAAKQTYRYDRAAVREMPNVADRLKRMAAESHVIRFMAPAEEVVVHDQVLGDVKYAAGEMDDFVIRKADGFPTYHFAVVVDDQSMGITHVMRAQEHLNNTPRHVALQKALGFRTPVYAHMPLIFNMDGTKMSKRDRDKAARRSFLARIKDLPPNPDAFAWLLERWVETSNWGPSTKAYRLSVVGEAIAHFARTPESLRTLASDDLVAQVWPQLSPAERSRLADHVRKFQRLLVAVSSGRFHQWLSDATVQLEGYLIDWLAEGLETELPEIEVHHFRANGYLPGAITNYLSLLGWNPGLKTPDGKDLEKFDMEFLAKNFAIDRIGKTNAKFDRAKLLSFNADAIGALTDEAFASTWRAWCKEYEPAFAARVGTDQHWLWLAKAVKPRARTLRDGVKSCAFLMRPDDSTEFDKAAVEKNLLANDRAGLKLLQDFVPVLSAVSPFEPAPIHTAIESFAQSRGLGMGPLAQAIRVAIAGAAVSPPLGETLAVLGRESALARVHRCLSTVA